MLSVQLKQVYIKFRENNIFFILNNKYSEKDVHEVAANPLEGHAATGKVKDGSAELVYIIAAVPPAIINHRIL